MSIPTSYTTNSPREEMLPFLPSTYQRVLEIGCGEGTFAQNLSGASERWGVEPNPVSAEKAKGALDRVLTGTYDHVCLELPDNYFDLVICNDVIEHMEDHDLFLDSIKTKMREGGYLVASIPNIRYIRVLFELLFKKDWRYRSHGTMDKSHLRFFTKKSLLRTLKEHGYNVRKFGGINRAGRPIYALHKSIPIALILLLTLGYYSDTLYVQFGFSAQK